MKTTQFALVVGLLVNSAVSAEDWLAFRGTNGAGVSTSDSVPTTWSNSENIAWSLDLPGKGYSSPIVVGDSVFVTCYSDGRDLSKLKRYLVRVNRKTGKPVWTREIASTADEKQIPQFAGQPGFASHTPASDGERIYVLLGNSGIHVFDMNGEIVWKKDVGKEERAMFGSAASPILYKNKVIVTAASESESIRAFDKLTGEELWKCEAAAIGRSYSTPVIGTSQAGVDELLFPVVGEVWGINPETGKLKWFCEAKTDTSVCPCIVLHDDIAYCLGGRGGGRTAIRLGGKKDVTKTHTEWIFTGGSYVPSPVVKGDHLYWVKDNGVVFCVDRKTGKEVGTNRIGGKFYASITLIGDKLYALSRFSGTHVLEATPELKVIAENPELDDSDHSASPAVADGQLFIRSDKSLYCIAAK